ncbi:MAG: hypothetical protein K0R62_5943 [Nonomuraea muscovyensis]|jgi:hypothetical protein|nr:hypothetical protein [Nonomuraea muscovyensis]
MELDQQTVDDEIERFFARHGRGWRSLARRQGWLVRAFVAREGLAILDRITFGVECSCCEEEAEQRWRLHAVKSEYRRRRSNRR